uniref:Uncharacterized protein n=1 Tax=Acrobeloides nanus TaxID=290746 RepID=A0A914EMU7_9BILA
MINIVFILCCLLLSPIFSLPIGDSYLQLNESDSTLNSTQNLRSKRSPGDVYNKCVGTFCKIVVIDNSGSDSSSHSSSGETIHVSPCNEVCNRIQREKNECCRAHGHQNSNSYCTNGMMYCFRK